MNPSASGSIGHTWKEADQGEQKEEEEAAEEEVEESRCRTQLAGCGYLSGRSGTCGRLRHDRDSMYQSECNYQKYDKIQKWRSKRWWRRRSSPGDTRSP